jgi:hypothetical protein
MKTNILTTALFLITTGIYSQIIEPTRFNLDSLHNPTNSADYKYIRVVENYNNDPKLFIFTEYYRSEKICMKAISTNKDKPYFVGPHFDYYENGNKKQQSNYVDNKLNGLQIDWYDNNVKKSEKEINWDSKNKDYTIKILQYWNPEGIQTLIDGNGECELSDDQIFEKGKLKNGEKQGIWEGKDRIGKFSFTEIYNEGIFVSGISTDENNTKYPYKELMTKPTPEKGMADFYKHIAKNFRTPKVQGLQGKIYITFAVDKEGNLTDYKILRDIGYQTGTEGIKAIRSYGKWIPGKNRGISAKVLYSIPISVKAVSGNYQNQGSSYESEMLRNTNPNW